MKKSFITVSALALLLAATSCSKDFLSENPRSVLVPSFLGTPEGVQAGLTGVYSGLRNVSISNEEAAYMTVTGTDEFMRGIAASQGYEDYSGLLIPTNSAATNQWSIIYRYINNANGVIQYASTVQGLPPATVAQIVAQAKILRAHYYFLLVQYYGDVPLQLAFVDAPTKDISRAPKAAVYNAIIADLTDALGTIADKAAQPGRVTRATALHMLSKVHLTRATSTAKQADDYAKAAQFATELINNKARYGVDLEADAADVFREGNESGKEVLMNVQFNADPTFTGLEPFNGTGTNQSSFFFRTRYELLPNVARSIVYGRPFARFIPTPYLVRNYILPTESGRQVGSTDTRWNKWFTNMWLVNSPGTNGTGGRTAVVGDTAALYLNRELLPAERARINSRPGGAYVVGTPSNFTTQFSPVLNKYDDPTRTGVNNPSDRPLIVYRFAETYLIAAEANMYLGNTAAAVGFINTIRQRAGAPGRKNEMNITAAQLNIDFILDERSRELGGEGMRWFDLVRTGKLIERVQAHVPAFVASKTSPTGGTDNYGSNAARNIVAGRTPEQFYLRPIPQQEIDRTGGKITQNPGYL
ncbi:RagB/SusD family nutrient uptake outer membrane protein [Hymenobacter sp. B1770]|uniref:RagB/SusD family nutrient uptake outer membrane protein n=1 Tax=Hymenobacter sp. B1770 TaxID=1718788 RepID=UPI003CFAB5F2